MQKSLMMIHTGDGKGKTTAALGLAFRSLGHGRKVCMIQFIKSDRQTGELAACNRFPELMECHVMGAGFTWKSPDKTPHLLAAEAAWRLARQKISSATYDLVILDEMTYPLAYGMIPEEEVIDFLMKRPPNTHVLITGRNASATLVAAADMVTEMVSVKHHFGAGIKAEQGIEF